VDITLFISDDLSTDNTISILQSYAESDSRIILLPSNSKFGSAGKNFYRLICDADFSSFDFIAFSDQDDVWLEDKLCVGIKQIIENKAEGYSSDVIAFWDDGREVYIKKSYPQKKYDYLFESGGPGCTFILTKKLAIKIKECLIANKFSEQSFFHHDWLIYALSRVYEMPWIIGETPGMMYRQHTANEIGVNDGFKAILARVKKMRNGWYLNHVYHLAKILNKEALLVRIIGKNKRFSVNFLFNFMSTRRRFRDCFFLLIFVVFKIAR
jgi:rhamnosyltransferase